MKTLRMKKNKKVLTSANANAHAKFCRTFWLTLGTTSTNHVTIPATIFSIATSTASNSKPKEERLKADLSKESCKMFIGGSNWDTTEDNLREYFGKYEIVTDLKIRKTLQQVDLEGSVSYLLKNLLVLMKW